MTYNKDDQIMMLTSILADAEFQEAIINMIRPEDFKFFPCQLACEVSKNYYNLTGATLTLPSLVTEVHRYIASNNLQLLNEEIDNLVDMFNTMAATPVDVEYYKSIFTDFIKSQRADYILSQLNQVTTQKQRDALLEDLASLQDLEASESSSISFIDDHSGVLSLQDEVVHRVSTGSRLLDSRINGGLAPGELGLIVACPGVGKTTTLINFAYGAILTNMYPLIITLEVKGDLIKRRFIAMCAGIKGRWINKPIEVWPKREKELYSAAMNTEYVKMLAVSDLSGGPKSIEQIVKAIKDWQDIVSRRFKNVKPCSVYIDHLDEIELPNNIAGKKNARTDEFLTAAMRKLANVAVANNLAIWTASQGTREATTKQILGMDHVAGAFHRLDPVTVGLGIGLKRDRLLNKPMTDPYSEFDEDLDDTGEELVFNIMKNRNGPKGFFYCYRGQTLRYWDRMDDAETEQALLASKTVISDWHKDLHQIPINNR